MKTLLLSTQIVKTFNKFVERGYYSRTSMADIMIISIINKINNNKFIYDNNELFLTNHNIAVWLLSFEEYFDEYLTKKKREKKRYWDNVYNKAIREGKTIKWTSESMMKNFSIDTAVFKKQDCIQICMQILRTSPDQDERDALSQLFLKICSYVFKDDPLFLDDNVLHYNWNPLAKIYFSHLRKYIDMCLKSYNTKEKIENKKANNDI